MGKRKRSLEYGSSRGGGRELTRAAGKNPDGRGSQEIEYEGGVIKKEARSVWRTHEDLLKEIPYHEAIEKENTRLPCQRKKRLTNVAVRKAWSPFIRSIRRPTVALPEESLRVNHDGERTWLPRRARRGERSFTLKPISGR